jgi:hypothetical protein
VTILNETKQPEKNGKREDSYGAAAADEGIDEHLVGQDVQLLLLLPLKLTPS